MPLDMCVSADAERHGVEDAVERTNRRAVRWKKAHTTNGQHPFETAQGVLYEELKHMPSEFLTALGLPRDAQGGLTGG